MTLLVLYGPPAAGKLTVAKHIAAKTGFKVFHNHISIDIAEHFFERGTSGFNNTIYGIRRLIFEELAKAKINFIFTVVYAHPQDIPDMRWMTRAIEKYGGEVEFVQLVCKSEQLLERVSASSRQSYGKITDPVLLESILGKYDLDTPYSEREGLRIDTSTQNAEASAKQIIEHFKLPRLSGVE
jgi:adenylate kinase family enzyme